METIRNAGKKLAKSKFKAIMIALITMFCIATIYATASNTNTVIINMDGIETRVTTLKTDADEIIKQAGIELTDNDIVDLSGFESGSDSVIKISKAYNVTVTDDGKSETFLANGTVAEALSKHGVIINEGDELNCDTDSVIHEGMEIVISRAFPVMITADGKVVTVKMAGGTVGDALDKAVITVADDDEISSPLDTVLNSSTSIVISRVTYKERKVKEAVPFKTEKKNSTALYKGQTKVEVKGVKGEKEVTYKDKYVDGKLQGSTAVNTVITKAAVNEVKLIGTKKKAAVVAASASTSGAKLANGVKTISRLTPPSSLTLNGKVPTSYKRKITGTASAYSGGGLTATGKSVMPGYIAVNPRQIPYHTKMWIVSNDGRYVYGYASAEDTGGFVNWSGSRSTLCDLYMSSESQCSAFGRRSVTIYIL
ncbi:MAG: ubiquitin-like domain-containing protein [Clostridia bacterium]|nr:ubiquitin-like domain-containing protein [Clostridia bacterium]